MLLAYLQKKLSSVLEPQHLRVLCGTWNVNEKQPSKSSLRLWLGARAQQGADLVCIAIQVRIVINNWHFQRIYDMNICIF